MLPEGIEYPPVMKNIFTDEVVDIQLRNDTHVIHASLLLRNTCACILTNVEELSNGR